VRAGVNESQAAQNIGFRVVFLLKN
jgi:hypothetical protein